MEISEAIKITQQMKKAEDDRVKQGYYGHKTYAEALETVLKEIENKENDIKVWEKVFDEDEQQICDLNNKICELEFELDKLKNLQEDNC